jgi:hypothetical protein
MPVSPSQKKHCQAQAAIEYVLLLTAVVVIVLLAFNTLIAKHQSEANAYFNSVARGLLENAVGNQLRTIAVYP